MVSYKVIWPSSSQMKVFLFTKKRILPPFIFFIFKLLRPVCCWTICTNTQAFIDYLCVFCSLVSRLQLLPRFLSPEDADWIFSKLLAELPWSQKTNYRQGVYDCSAPLELAVSTWLNTKNTSQLVCGFMIIPHCNALLINILSSHLRLRCLFLRQILVCLYLILLSNALPYISSPWPLILPDYWVQ